VANPFVKKSAPRQFSDGTCCSPTSNSASAKTTCGHGRVSRQSVPLRTSGTCQRCGRRALRKRGGKEHRLVPIVRLDSMEYCPRTNREEPTWGEAPPPLLRRTIPLKAPTVHLVGGVAPPGVHSTRTNVHTQPFARTSRFNLSSYFGATTSAPALAHCPSCAAVPPETPIAPAIFPSIKTGSPPSTGIAPCNFNMRSPSPPAASAS
jgi:hypothetical protein